MNFGAQVGARRYRIPNLVDSGTMELDGRIL